MKNAEQTFNAIAEKEMHEWGLEGFKNTYPTLFKVIMLSMEQHANQEHSRKCQEAGRELPDVNFVPHDKQYDSNEDGANWMKGFAIKLLASLQSQLEAKEQELRESVGCTEHMKEVCDNYQKDLEAKDKEIEYLKHCEKAREEETEGWERLKVIAEENYPIEKIVGRDVSQVIEKLFKELKSQLQEAKADYESIKITLGHYERDIQEANAEVESVKGNMLRFIEWRDTIGISKLFSIEQQYEQFLKESQLTQHKAEEK